jgi:hypothetical protein
MRKRKICMGILFLFVFVGAAMSFLSGGLCAEPKYPHEEFASSQFDSLNVKFLGDWPFGHSHAVAIDTLRDLVFCGSGGGVYILSTIIPSNPIRISDSIQTRGFVEKLYFDEDLHRLYISAGEAGFEIWDVSNPVDPQKLGSLNDTIHSVQGLDVAGDYAYLVAGNLHVIDISDPNFPFEVGSCIVSGSARDVHIQDSIAFVAAQGLRIIDISIPQSPHEIGYFPFIQSTGIFVSDTFAFLVCEPGLWIINVSDPVNPQDIGFLITPGKARARPFISDSFAFVADGDSGVCIIDISTPANPQLQGIINTPGESMDVKVFSSIAYIADKVSHYKEKITGLRIVDVSNPSNPIEVGFYNTPDLVYGIFVLDTLAYLATRYGGLRLIDISPLSNPKEVGSYEIDCAAYDVWVAGTYAYVANGDSGLRILDVSDPSNPQEVGYHANPHMAVGIYILDTLAFIASNLAGLQILDISLPTQPQEIGWCDTDGWASRVWTLGDYAYVADALNGLAIIDVSDPANPNQVSHIIPPDGASDVCVSGSYAYTTDDGVGGGFYVIDVSDPYNPFEVGRILRGWPWEVVLIDKYVYIVGNTCNLCVIDISTPTNPIEVGDYWMPQFSTSVAALGSNIFVGTWDAGLQIYENMLLAVEERKESGIRTTIRLLQNPICGNYIELALSLPAQKSVTLDLYDLLGRGVRSFKLDQLSSGKQQVKLDVKDLSAGTYFLKLKDGPLSQTEKLILLR